MGTKLSDEELMLAFQDGDVGAFEKIMKRHRNGVYNFIYRFFRNSETAEEVFQEVFIKLYKAVSRYTPSGKFTTWLYTITRNQCVDTFRRLKIRRAMSLESPVYGEEGRLGDTIESPHHDAEVLSSAHEIEEIMDLALSKLNPDQKEVFWLREKEGFKFEEIAKMTDVSVNTVKSRMRYALEGLRKVLKQSKYRELVEPEVA